LGGLWHEIFLKSPKAPANHNQPRTGFIVNQVEELERAILSRAKRLADEYRERAQHSRDNILREAAERLRLREQREESIARSLGDRTYRQQVQASELKMQSHLDRVRWNLVTDVEGRLRERMQIFMADDNAYGVSLKTLLAQAAVEIEAEDLVAELNARDRQRLEPEWDSIVAEAAPGKTVRLAEEPIECVGGIRVRSSDNRIRVDNTFEGRLERLRSRIQQVILERLLPGGLETGSVFSG
jgi:V/A-type H+-transporting ATPase subunit E